MKTRARIVVLATLTASMAPLIAFVPDVAYAQRSDLNRAAAEAAQTAAEAVSRARSVK